MTVWFRAPPDRLPAAFILCAVWSTQQRDAASAIVAIAGPVSGCSRFRLPGQTSAFSLV